MKKLATKLTPAIKAWIKEEFGSDYYSDNREDCLFHFPNYDDFQGFKISFHLNYFGFRTNYTEVSEKEFLAEFAKPKRPLNWVLVKDDDDDIWQKKLFLTEIKGARYPFVCVKGIDAKAYINGYFFSYTEWQQMKPCSKTITKEEAEKLLNNKYLIE